MATEGLSVYTYWQKLGARVNSKDKSSPLKYTHAECVPFMVRTVFDTDTVENPQCGGWKVQVGGGYKDGVKQPKKWLPIEIFAATKGNPNDKKTVWGPGLELYALYENDRLIGQDEIIKLWERTGYRDAAGDFCRYHMPKDEKDFYKANKRWPTDPAPLAPKHAAVPAQTHARAQTEATVEGGDGSANPRVVPGDNSKDLDAYNKMKAEIVEDLGTLEAHVAKKPIKTKADADHVENWANRVAEAIAEFEKARVAEKAPHLAKCVEIDGRYNPLIKEWTPRRKAMQDAVDKWAAAERARLQKEAEEKAAADLEADRKRKEAEHADALARQAEVDAYNKDLEINDPIAFETGSKIEDVEIPPAPEVEAAAPQVYVAPLKVGTGRKRTAGTKAAPKTAIITDLAAAAAHLAANKDPDLIALVQKRADAAAKVDMDYPGCTRSDPAKGAAA